jgi:hypothetical protein
MLHVWGILAIILLYRDLQVWAERLMNSCSSLKPDLKLSPSTLIIKNPC